MTRTAKDFRVESSQVASSSSSTATSQADQGASVGSSSTSRPAPPSPAARSLPHRAAIAIGANVGDRFANIECALRLLETSSPDTERSKAAQRIVVVDTSFMYETTPMYVEDQPLFINCACMVGSSTPPWPVSDLFETIVDRDRLGTTRAAIVLKTHRRGGRTHRDIPERPSRGRPRHRHI